MTNPCDSSDLLSANKALMTRSGRLRGILAYADGTNAATVTVYDNATTNSGKVLAQALVKAGDKQAPALGIPEQGIVANNGLYVVISGTGAQAIILYSRE